MGSLSYSSWVNCLVSTCDWPRVLTTHPSPMNTSEGIIPWITLQAAAMSHIRIEPGCAPETRPFMARQRRCRENMAIMNSYE